MQHYKINLLTIIFISLIVVSCKTKQQSVKLEGEIEEKTTNGIVEDALKAELSYTTISAKGSVTLNNQKVTAVFKIVKDSIIQASVRPILGMEAARITFTPDSIFFLDRFNKQYMVENFSSSLKEKQIDFNFHNLQALLTNQIFIAGEQTVEKSNHKSFKSSITKDAYLLNLKDKNKLQYNFVLNASNRITSVFIINNAKTHTLQWLYKDFVTDGNYIYPRAMEAEFTSKDKKINIAIDYSSLDIDGKFDVDNSIPKSYEKTEIKTLLEKFTKK